MIEPDTPSLPRPDDGESVEMLIDADDRVLSCSCAWDRFALDNDAPELTQADVVGKPLQEFISGKVTRAFTQALVDRVRATGRPLEVPYRCDSPRVRRFMVMELRPLAGGRVICRHRLLSTEPLPSVVRIEVAPQRARGTLVRCSLCGRIQEGEAWIEPLLLSRRQVLGPRQPLLVTYGICPECARWVNA